MDSIKCLSELTQLGIITPVELSEWTAKVLGSSVTPTPPVAVVTEAPFVLTSATKLESVKQKLVYESCGCA